PGVRAHRDFFRRTTGEKAVHVARADPGRSLEEWIVVMPRPQGVDRNVAPLGQLLVELGLYCAVRLSGEPVELVEHREQARFVDFIQLEILREMIREAGALGRRVAQA